MLNLVALMGRLCNDPELRHTSNDVAVCSFTLAVDRSFQKASQDRQADFIDIVAWRSQAEFSAKYFRKGQLVAVQGSIQTRSYTDKDGNKRKAFEIVADQVHFAESKKDPLTQMQKQAQVDGIPQYSPQYAAQDTGDFEEMPSDYDLPFDH